MSLKTKLTKLAESIVDAALAEDCSLEQQIEALKVTGEYWAKTKRAAKKSGEDDEPDHGSTFEGFKQSINGTGKRRADA